MKTERVAIPVMAAIPWDTTEYCCKLEGGFISSLLGLGQILKLYRLWDGTDEEIQTMMEQVEKGLLGLMGFPCCDDAITSIRQSKGGYMVGVRPDGTEQRISSVYNSTSYAEMPETQSMENAGNNVCAGVRLLVDRLLEDVLYSLDQAQFAADTGQAIAQGISALVDLVTLGAFPLEDVYDGAQEFFFTTAELGISGLKLAFSDPDVRDKMVENIYCAIMESSPYLLTDEIYLNAVSGLPLLEAQSTVLSFFMRGFSTLGEPNWDRIYRLYNLGALGSDPTCEAEFDCTPGWILECDLTLSDGGFHALVEYNIGGEYVPGVGWRSTIAPTTNNHRNVGIGITMPEALYTGAGMTFSYEQGVMAGSGTVEWLLVAGGHTFAALPSNTTPPTSPWDATGDEHEGTDAQFIIPVGLDNIGNDPGGVGIIQIARVYGTGTPPTIEGWSLVE